MSILQETTGVILAGGFGTRLRSVVPDKPKVIAEVRGRPFVTYLLDQLADAGIRSVVLCTGYMADQVEACLGANYRGMTLSYSKEDTPLGTGGAVRLALSKIGSQTALVLNGDSFCAVELLGFAEQHRETGARATLALSATDDTRRYGRVDVAENGEITGFVEKAAVEGPGWVNVGFYLVDREFLESIPPNAILSLEKEVFPLWIGRGLYGFRSDGELWDIGVPDAYARANAEFLTQ